MSLISSLADKNLHVKATGHIASFLILLQIFFLALLGESERAVSAAFASGGALWCVFGWCLCSVVACAGRFSSIAGGLRVESSTLRLVILEVRGANGAEQNGGIPMPSHNQMLVESSGRIPAPWAAPCLCSQLSFSAFPLLFYPILALTCLFLLQFFFPLSQIWVENK